MSKGPGSTAPSALLLKRFRFQLSWSQENLADFLGVSHRTMVRWERQGDNLPQAVTMLLTAILDNPMIHKHFIK